MIPDLFHYFLCGARAWSTPRRQPLRCIRHRAVGRGTCWTLLEIPSHILPEVVVPGTRLGPVRPGCFAGRRLAIASLWSPLPRTTPLAQWLPSLIWTKQRLHQQRHWSLMGSGAARADDFRRGIFAGLYQRRRCRRVHPAAENLTGLWILQECQRQWASEGSNLTWSDITAGRSSACVSCSMSMRTIFSMPSKYAQAIAAVLPPNLAADRRPWAQSRAAALRV